MVKKSIGIIGATGLVGQEIIKCLHRLNFPVNSLKLYASDKSIGKKIDTSFGELTIIKYRIDSIENLDIVFLCVSSNLAIKYTSQILETSNPPFIIDNSSAFRYKPEIPLIVPQINSNLIKNSKLISNPNCTTAIASVVLNPIHTKYKIKKLFISTYQASSGAGNNGIEELKHQTCNYLENIPLKSNTFQYPLAFNLIPHIDTFLENGYTREEMKVVWELKKILNEPDLDISCTAVRIPIFRAHSESIVIETRDPVNITEVKNILANSPGVVLKDDACNNIYPMPLTASKNDLVEVGRIRQNLVFGKNGIELFIVGDQLLRGAALNAVQIALKLI